MEKFFIASSLFPSYLSARAEQIERSGRVGRFFFFEMPKLNNENRPHFDFNALQSELHALPRISSSRRLTIAQHKQEILC